MEKYIIIVLLFFFNPVIGQKIKVVDSQNDPIYNVGFFKKDQTKAKFSNFKGEVDEASKWIKDNGNQKPVVGFIAGQTAPKGKRMGHAGAIIGGKDDTAKAKMKIMMESGLTVAESPANIGSKLKEVL